MFDIFFKEKTIAGYNLKLGYRISSRVAPGIRPGVIVWIRSVPNNYIASSCKLVKEENKLTFSFIIVLYWI